MIYTGSEKITEANVGNKDMVCIMQDNHILALGKRYWAINMGTLSYSYDSSNQRFYCAIPAIATYVNGRQNPYIYIAGYECLHNEEPFDITWNMKVYNSAGNVEIIYFHNHDYDNPDDFKASMNNVWLVYGFNQTLYAKIDLGSLSWNYNTSLKYYHTASLREVIKIPANNNTVAKIYSFIFKSETLNNIYNDSATYDNSIAVQAAPVGSDGYVVVSKQSLTSVADFTRFVTGKEFLYEVAE